MTRRVTRDDGNAPSRPGRLDRLAAAVLALSLAFASGPAPRLAAADGEPPGSETPADGAEEKDAGSRLVTLDLRDARIENVLRLLAAQTDTNIIAGPGVTGSVTVSFRDVDFENALGLILRSAGYAYRVQGNVIEVFRPEEAPPGSPTAPPARVTASFALRYASGEEILAALKPVTAPDAILFNRERNVLVIHDVPDAVERARALIETIDRRRLQVRIEARIVEIGVGERESLGIDWTTVISANGSRRPWIFPFDRRADGGDFFAPNQTQGDNVTFSGSTSTTTASNLPQFPEDGPFPFPLPKEFVFGSLDFTQFQAVLELIDADSRSKVVATPEITTLDNEEAVIDIGEKVPIPTYSRNEQTSVTTVSGYQEISVGTKLRVTPRVNDSDSITLVVEPEVSDIVDFRGPNNEFPLTSSRSAKTIVTLEDGKTLVIGGLLRERTRSRETKFPLLGDIPLLQYLFTYRSESKERNEMMIFITPHIIDVESEKKAEDGLTQYEGRWIPARSADLVRTTVAGLAARVPEARVAACETLSLSEDPSLREILDRASLLERAFRGDPDTAVRIAGGRGLRRIDVRRYVGALRAAADRKEARALEAVASLAASEEARHLRWIALFAAREIDAAGAARFIEKSLDSPLPFVRENAAESLGVIGDGDSVAHLVRHLRSEARGPSLPALVALSRIATEDARRALDEAGRALSAERSPRLEVAREALARSIGAPRAGTALHAAMPPAPADAAPARRTGGPRLSAVVARALARVGNAPIPVTGDGALASRVSHALELLLEKSPTHHDLVASYAASIEIAAFGPSTIDAETGAIRIAAADAERWSLFNMAHVLVHFATHRLLAVAGEDATGLVAESICFEEQYRAVLALAQDPDAASADPSAFLDEVLRARPPEGGPIW